MNVDWFPDDQWLTGNDKAPDRKTVDESDNSFGDWSDFKSSSTTQDTFSNSWKQDATPDNQTVADNDDFSAAWNDFTSLTSAKDPSSISFKQMEGNPDFFSGAFSHRNGSCEINFMRPEAHVSDRMADANVRGGNNNDDEFAKDGDFSTATTGSKTDDVEILMSQMHDLSFILESNISIPSKADGWN
ncbi:hypothetical protein DITRI_Ditri13aG0145200 [Diplodiscus trichospermus]